jgi:hypothetical protein
MRFVGNSFRDVHTQTFGGPSDLVPSSNYILDRLSLLQKLEFVRARIYLPPRFYKDIRDLNTLRNALAHSFFPENRRVKPKWKGFDIFSFEGVGQFINDTTEASDFFFARLRRQGRYTPSLGRRRKSFGSLNQS